MISRFITILSSIALLFLNTQFWHYSWLGWVILPLFFWFTSEGFERMLIKFFNFSSNARTKFFGALLSFMLFGWFCGAGIIFYRLTPWYMAAAMAIVGFVSLIMDHWSIKAKRTEINPPDNDKIIAMPQSRLYLVSYFIFFIFGLVLLWQSRSAQTVWTPWQIISPHYIYLFFLAVLTLGGLMFSQFKIKTLLLLLVLQTFMLVAYLPLTQQMFYGADGWRHLAVIENAVDGKKVHIQNYATQERWIDRVNPGMASYSQFWGTVSSLSELLNLKAIYLISWLQPIFFAIFFPILLYEIGVALGWGERKPLIFAWLGLWPFALHAAGSFSLPVSFGFVLFLFLLLLILKRAEQNRREQVFILLGLGVLSFFGYGLFAILFWLIWACLELIKQLNTKIVFVLLIAGVSLVLPVLELAVGYSQLTSDKNILSQAVQAAGNFSGYYLASGPRSHLIDTGNVFFNQVPSYLFVPNALTVWRWWMVGFMVLVFAGVIIGAIKMVKSHLSRDRMLAIAGIGFFLSYLIGRYILSGDQILSRRLDVVVAFVGILFVFKSIEKVFDKNQFASVLIILAGAAAITASYSLGPVSRAVSRDEYGAAERIWAEIKNDDHYCVVADTYELLALEAISKKKVIGGGFPIDKNFGQPELVKIYEEIISNNYYGLDLANYRSPVYNLTGASKCFFVNYGTSVVTNTPMATIGDISIYKF